MTHVSLYAGEGKLIEGPGTGEKVREVSLREKYGKDREELKAGRQVAGGRTVYFGRYLDE